MAGFLRVVKGIKSHLSKTSEYFELGCAYVKNFLPMEKNNGEDQNYQEPPSKKFCIDNVNKEEIIEKKRIKKRNVALLLAYNGSKYYGMQKNCEFQTIESELLSALEKSNFIPPEAVNDLHLIHFQRAARTDKGVSAAKQVVSFKIAENFNIENINAHLPEDIRVFCIKRVTKGFNCKNQCFGRTYSYTLPTFALAPELHTEYPKDYRIDKETLLKVNDELSKFIGTHSFHNFTSRKDSRDPSAKRYILNFKTEEPFIDREEFITLKIKGQSFMLHQIRKMVGFVIATLKGFVPESIQAKVWSNEKVSVPMVPGLGLVLEDVHYDKYNRKFGNDGMHTPLTWNEVDKELEAFRKENIFSKIIDTEISEKVMFEWLQCLPNHKFEFSGNDASDEVVAEVEEGENLPESKNCSNSKIKAENCV